MKYQINTLSNDFIFNRSKTKTFSVYKKPNYRATAFTNKIISMYTSNNKLMLREKNKYIFFPVSGATFVPTAFINFDTNVNTCPPLLDSSQEVLFQYLVCKNLHCFNVDEFFKGMDWKFFKIQVFENSVKYVRMEIVYTRDSHLFFSIGNTVLQPNVPEVTVKKKKKIKKSHKDTQRYLQGCGLILGSHLCVLAALKFGGRAVADLRTLERLIGGHIVDAGQCNHKQEHLRGHL